MDVGGNNKILLIDDDESIASSLSKLIALAGYEVTAESDPIAALKLYKSGGFSLALCDHQMPGLSGIEFIERCGAHETPIILMAGYGDEELAFQAISKGAADYISKPFDMSELTLVLHKIEARRAAQERPGAALDSEGILFQSAKMKEIFANVERLAQYQTTVLITGESGTGKELLARAIHKSSSRAAQKFVAINCGAIPEHLIESELFGHKRGAFTDAIRDKKGLFEEASGGTVFLDEIGELPLHLQVKLLRALQEQKIRRVGDEEQISLDIRVIAATLKDLESEVKAERFREDLYYRLNVVNIHLPALRERPEDIPLLANHFVKKHNKRLGLNKLGFSSEAMKLLSNFIWRGNIRELENCVERAMVMSDADEIDIAALPNSLKGERKAVIVASPTMSANPELLSIKQRTRELEIDLINRALKKTNGNRTHAAKILEISHRALLYKIKEYRLGGDDSGKIDEAAVD